MKVSFPSSFWCLLGAWLKRTTLVDQNLWLGLEQFGYYILFPALLFSTLAQADFSGMKADATAIATIGSVSLMSIFVLFLWPLFRNREVSGASFTSVFQTATRWNGFMALAIAQKLYGPIGLTLTALVMTLVIIPINLYNVGVLVWFGGGNRDFRRFFAKIATNPLIVASVLGIVFNRIGHDGLRAGDDDHRHAGKRLAQPRARYGRCRIAGVGRTEAEWIGDAGSLPEADHDAGVHGGCQLPARHPRRCVAASLRSALPFRPR